MKLTRQNFIYKLFLELKESGFCIEDLCKELNLDYRKIENQELILSEETAEEVWKLSVLKTKNPELGFFIGKTYSIETLGLLGLIIHNSRTIEDAIVNACEYSNLSTDFCEMRLKKNKNNFQIIIEPEALLAKKYPNRSKHICLLTLAVCFKAYSLLTYRKNIHLIIGIPYKTASLKSTSKYKIMNTSFSGNYIIEADSELLTHPVVNSNYIILSNLIIEAQRLLEKNTHSLYWTKRVQREILIQFNGSFLGIKDVAELVNTSERTLQRHLRNEHTTYSKILNNIKLKLAVPELKRTESVKQVAFFLGFKDSTSFIKAFKRWTNSTPKEFLINLNSH